ncbi:MAG: chemotaxis protein CheB [Cyclobacteriaceae bacterium]
MTIAKPDKKLSIVGIGASSGGLEALRRFFTHVPGTSGLAYVVVVHLSPDYESSMVHLLQSCTRMPVQEVTEEVQLQADHVYIIPPNANLNSLDSHLRLSPLADKGWLRAPIDHFFRTLARTHQGYAVGIVMSGSGVDGTLGLREIRQKGGFTMVQDPQEARYDSMPRNALSSGMVDVVMPVEEMGAFVVGLLGQQPGAGSLPGFEENHKESKLLVKKIASLMSFRTGRDFSRFEHQVMMQRLWRRIRLHQLEKPSEYLQQLRKHPEEVRALADDVLLNSFSFFYTENEYTCLEKKIIPRLFENKSEEEAIRVWVTGCSTGEQVYSLAMLLTEAADLRNDRRKIQIFASDLHEKAMNKARKGFFTGNIHLDVDQKRLQRFFTHENGGYQVRDFLRKLVVFSEHELLTDPPFSKLDLIVCQQLLIRLKPELREELLSNFRFALLRGGTLMIDAHETAFVGQDFEQLEEGMPLFFKTSGDSYPGQHAMSSSSNRELNERVTHAKNPPPASFGQIHQRLLQSYEPPSLLISAEYRVLHVTDKAGRYLVFPAGVPNQYLFNLLRPELHLEVRSLLLEARESPPEVWSQALRLSLDGKERQLRIRARYVNVAEQGELILLCFEESDVPPSQASGLTQGAVEEAGPNSELSHLRLQIQEIMRDYEENQLKLRTANEELVSSNEELKSTLEELVSSREQMLSTNEELRMVNQENSVRLNELHQVSDDLENLLKSTQLATLFLDKELKIVRYTPQAEELFNIMPYDKGRILTDQTHRLHYPELVKDAEKVLDKLLPQEREIQDQEGRYYLVRVLPYVNSEKRITGVVLTFIDISERREREKAEQQRKTAEEAARAKDEFLSVMSHEIRTPLNAIIGISNLLAKDQLSPTQQKNLNALQFSSKNLMRLINDVLDYSKLEAGKMQVEHINYQLDTLLESLQHACEPQVNEKGLKLLFEVAPDVPKHLMGDPHKLTQVLNNLLGNALKFTEKGRVKLEVRLLGREETAAELQFSVSDTGIGIAEEKLQQIFEKFSQADSSTVRRFGGTGLGLAISRQLLTLMHSHLHVNSREGEGATFYFRLRQALAQESDKPKEDVAPVQAKEAISMKNVRLLMAEDVAVNRMVLQQYLYDWWQIEADEAENGLLALEKVKEQHYDLILMDVFMPEMDGREAAKGIRKLNPYYAQLPILALTADTKIQEEHEQGIGPFSAVIGKPFEPQALKQTIEDLLQGRSGPVIQPVQQKEYTETDMLLPDFAGAEEPFKTLSGRRDKFYKMAIKSLREFREEVMEAFEKRDTANLEQIMHKEKLMFSMLGLNNFYENIRESRHLLEEGISDDALAGRLQLIREGLNTIIERTEAHAQTVA